MPKKKLPFPYPCEDVPRFETQHEVLVFIEEYKAQGYFKPCAHLSYGERLCPGSTIATDYTPECRKDSFDAEDDGNSRSQFYGCPSDCRLYQAAWWGKTKGWLKYCWWPFRRFVVGTGDWYKSLAPLTQALWALIILALLALLGLPLFEMILRALSVIFG